MIQRLLVLFCLWPFASGATGAPAAMSADVAASIQLIHAMMPIRFLITKQISVLSTGASFAVRGPLNDEIKDQQNRDFGKARLSWQKLVSYLGGLEGLLPDFAERQLLVEARDQVAGFDFGSLKETEARSVANCARARKIIDEGERISRTLESFAMTPGKLESFEGTSELSARCEALIAEATRLELSRNLIASLKFQSVMLKIAPIFSRHSLAKLCKASMDIPHQ